MARKSTATTVTGAPRPRVNASRSKWPPIRPDPATGKFDPAYTEYVRDLALCENLVRMGSGILRRKLELIVGGPDQGIVRAATDGTRIWLPKMHPRRRVVIKHELSHLYFLSDLDLRRAFTLKLVEELEGLMGIPLAPQAKDRLVRDIEFFINVLDDVRVNSLWGVLYPGDGLAMDEWYYKLVGPDMAEKAKREHKDGDIDDLFTFAILICLHQDVKSTTWGEFEADIRDARDGVLYKAFPASLALTRDLILRIARKIAERQQTQPVWGGGVVAADAEDDDLVKKRLSTRTDMRSAILKIATGKPPGDAFVDHNAGFDIQEVDGTPRPAGPPSNPKTSILLANLYKALDGDLPDFLDGQEAAGLNLAQQIQKAMNNLPHLGNFKNDKDYLGKAVRADLSITNVKRGDLVPSILNPADREEVTRWRSRFQRVHGSTRTQLEEAGHELCTDAYIQQKLGGHPLEPYFHEVSGRGFRVTILLDMSGSMVGTFGQVERLVVGLQKAMDFPFVHLRVMGFQQTGPGKVDVIIYPARPPGLRSATALVQGATPLSHAIAVASQWMKGQQDDRSIFLISDGKPVFTLKDSKSGALPEQTLMAWTKEAVEQARTAKVKTYAFMLGDDVPSDAEMTFMFGARRWRKIPEAKLFQESFAFITAEFLRFVRAR